MRANKKKKVWFIDKILFLFLLVASLFLMGNLLFLNVLSNFYLFLVIFFLIAVNLLFFKMVFWGKRKGISRFFLILLILILGLVDFYLGKTTGLLSRLNLNYKTYNYSVVVMKESSYHRLKDISGKKLGYYDSGSEEVSKALNKVMRKEELSKVGYEDTEKLAQALLDGTVDSILIENSYLEILNENVVADGQGFKSLVRTIYSFVIVQQTNDISRDINVTKTPFSIYISGIDTYGEISSVSRSDVNMVVTVNPETRQILMTSIPRDYYVQLHGKSGYKDKLTHAGLYGIDMSIQTIEDLLDIKINYYVKVNFSSVVDIVNAIGGVNVYSDYTFTSIDNYHYTKGYNAVNGEEALSFARERKAFATGDRQRVLDQQALLRAIFEKCASKEIIVKYSKLLDSLQNSFVTNMKMSRLTSLIKLQLSKNYDWNIVTNSLNGSDAKNYTYSAPSTRAYVMEPEEDSVSYAHQLIQKVLEGEKLDKETVVADSSKANRVTKKDTSDSSVVDKKDDSVETKSSSDNTEKLVLKLGKSEVSYQRVIEKDGKFNDFTYYGYTLLYQGVDVSKNSGVRESFKVNGSTFNQYGQLISYMNELKAGTYTIVYEIVYQGYVVRENQKVVITEVDKRNDSDEDLRDDKDEDSSDLKNDDGDHAEYPSEGED